MERISKQSAKGSTVGGKFCGITFHNTIKRVKTVPFANRYHEIWCLRAFRITHGRVSRWNG